MNAKSEMLAARDAIAKALDAKLANVPEWSALRAVDRAITAYDEEHASVVTSTRVIGALARPLRMPSYADTALKMIEDSRKPVTTPALMAFLTKQRDLGDIDKAKVNVTSSLSKDSRLRSIRWAGGSAWWHANRSPPTPTSDDILDAAPEAVEAKANLGDVFA